jgi:hypothetical protein
VKASRKLEKQGKGEESSTALNNFCRLAPDKASKSKHMRNPEGGETKEISRLKWKREEN